MCHREADSVFVMWLLLWHRHGHRLHTIAAGPSLTQPSTLHWMVKWVWSFSLSNSSKCGDSSLQTDAQLKLVGIVWGLALAWHCSTLLCECFYCHSFQPVFYVIVCFLKPQQAILELVFWQLSMMWLMVCCCCCHQMNRVNSVSVFAVITSP